MTLLRTTFFLSLISSAVLAGHALADGSQTKPGGGGSQTKPGGGGSQTKPKDGSETKPSEKAPAPKKDAPKDGSETKPSEKAPAPKKDAPKGSGSSGSTTPPRTYQ